MFRHINKDFPDDQEYWMVTWIHSVILKDNDYQFHVDLVAIKNMAAVKEPKPYHSNNYDKKHLTIHIGCGLFPLVEIGSIWQNKRLVFSSMFLQHPESTLTISIPDPKRAANITLHDLAQRVDSITSFHPFRNIDYPTLGESWCHILETDTFTVRGDERINFLAIPASELLRFYYCGSSSLLRQLLANGIPHGQVYIHDSTRYEPETRELSIRMRGHLRDSDALFVGRIAGDETAYRMATDLGKHIQVGIINQGVGQLRTGFPFGGPTELRVSGKWVKTPNASNKWAFLVYSIISCTGELPFTELHFYRENDNSKTENPLEERQVDRGAVREPTPPHEDATISSLLAPESGYAKGRLHVLLSAREKFLEAPPVHRIEKEQQLVATRGERPRWYVKLPIYTDKDGNTGIGADVVGPVGTDVQQPDPPSIGTGVDYSQFHEITGQLRLLEIGCLYISYDENSALCTSTEYADFSYPLQNVTPKSKIGRWLLLHTRTTRKTVENRTRRVAVLRLTYGGHEFYLLECEARKSENFSRLLVKPNAPDYNISYVLRKLFVKLAKKRGAWSRVKSAKLDITKQAIHHGKTDTPTQVAVRIVGYLQEMV